MEYMPYVRTAIWLVLFIILASWIYLNYYWQLHNNLKFSPHHAYQVTGVIDSLPQYQSHHLSFIVKLQSLENIPAEANIKLNWYGKPPFLHIGETWQLIVKLKHPNSIPIFNNFDYGRWLELHNIQAAGYVVSNQNNQRIKITSPWNFRYRLDQWRSNIEKQIYQNLKNTSYRPEAALVSGLTVGIRTAMTTQQWADFQNTGTVHLMAIAGLHIGFCAGFVFLIINYLWSRSVKLMLIYPSQRAASIAALLAAFIYALMAGFALPTQRAFIMMAVMTLTQLSNRNINPIRSLSLALILILIWDPLAILSASFWLSFSAVALIFYGIYGRINSHSSLWARWGKIQWVLSVGLTPLTLWFFQLGSLSGLLANLLAIPLVGFIVIPLCLIGCIFLGVWQTAAHGLLITAAFVLHYLMKMLDVLAFMPYAVWHFSFVSISQFLTLILACVLILAPRGMPVQWLGVLLLICVLLC